MPVFPMAMVLVVVSPAVVFHAPMQEEGDMMAHRYKQLLTWAIGSREIDQIEAALLGQGEGMVHLGCGGHEPLACLAFQLKESDVVFPHYRDRALMLARGVDIRAYAAAFFATRDSESRGKHFPSHFGSHARGVWPPASVFPSHALAACGVAWGMVRGGQPNMVVCCVGEGATRQGEFYEALCVARQMELPILFVVEDNGLSISTGTAHLNPHALGMIPADMLSLVHASDVGDMADKLSEAVHRVRQEREAVVVWAKLNRLCPHSSYDDQSIYRTSEELASLRESDPLETLISELKAGGAMDDTEVERIRREARKSVVAAYREAATHEPPSPDDALANVLGPDPEPTVSNIAASRRERIGDAVNAVFRQMLEATDTALFFGQDIEDPLGGVFRLTKGLSSAFPGRVVNAPLAEATMIGVGCGLASYGFRPVVEVQFADFLGPGWSQLVNNAATLRWRSDGQWKCPMIVYAPSGAYLPGGGPWHSQQPTGALATNPGLRIAVPSTPDDAAGLFWTAFHCDDPTVILLPKHMLWKRFPVQGSAQPVAFGRARLIRPGMDMTVVCWGNCTELVAEAAEVLDGELCMEILDLRSVIPWDKDAVRASLEKTGRLLVVQEETESCSPGQMVISWAVTDAWAWGSLRCQPVLLSKPDVHIGFNPVYEKYNLPTMEKVIEAARNLIAC